MKGEYGTVRNRLHVESLLVVQKQVPVVDTVRNFPPLINHRKTEEIVLEEPMTGCNPNFITGGSHDEIVRRSVFRIVLDCQ